MGLSARTAVCLLGAAAIWAAASTSANAAATSTLSGRVTDPAGNGIADVNVSLYRGGAGTACCTWVIGATTDAAGNFSITADAGIYRVLVHPSPSSAFVGRWWSASGVARIFDRADDVDLNVNVALGSVALEPGFLISGTVRDGAGAPIPNVNVSAYANERCCTWVGGASTDADGRYQVRVPVGTYRLQMYPPASSSYIAQWWNGATGAGTFEGGVDVAVSADVTGKDAVLATGRRISGRVTSDGSTGIAGAGVNVFRGGPGAACCTWVSGTGTDATGAWSLVVPAAVYRLQVSGPASSMYVSQWWDGLTGQERFDTAPDITISVDRADLNAMLQLGRRISGRVTSDGTTGIAGANVSAFVGGSASCCSWVGGAGTDATGAYSFIVRPGTYRLYFQGPSGGAYIAQWWNGAPAGASRFDLALDIDTSMDVTKDARLTVGVHLAGRVTSNGTAGIASVGVGAFLGGATSSCCTFVAGAGTDTNGAFDLVLPAGTYRLHFYPPPDSSFIQQWYGGPGRPGAAHFDGAVDIALSSPVTDILATLEAGVRITGHVTSSPSSAAVPGAFVSAFMGGATVCCTWVSGTSADATGAYVLTVPANRAYRLQASGPPGSSYIVTWYNAAARFDDATDVAVGTTAVSRDITLTTGRLITGRVTNAGGTGIARVGVGAFVGGSGSTCCTWLGGAGTDANGDFTLAVPVGAYRISFWPPQGSSFIQQWYDGGTGAQRFDVAVDVDVTAGDVALAPITLRQGLRISGRVTSDGTTGIAGVSVNAFVGGSSSRCCTWVSGTGTDGDGNYTVVVGPGTYRLMLYPPQSSSYIAQWWTSAGGSDRFDTADDIAVTAADVTGKNARLTTGVLITGRVTSTTGAPIANVNVSAYTGGANAACCTWVAGAGTDQNGDFRLAVTPGTYRIQFWPQPGLGHLGAWWSAAGGSVRFDLAADVSATTGASGIDIALASGFVLRGKVTNAVAQGIAGAGVGAYVGGANATCCLWMNGSGTDANGDFALTLPAGTYRLQVWAPQGSDYVSSFWTAAGGVDQFDNASDIPVTVNTTLAPNAILTTGYAITGFVKTTTGAPIQGAGLSAQVCSGFSCTWAGYAGTDATGAFRLVVRNGTYKINVSAPYGSSYIGEWFNNKTNVGAADPVTVSGASKAIADIVLETGHHITGQVRDDASTGIASVYVTAYTCVAFDCQWVTGTSSSANGGYALVVPAGTYKLRADPSPGSRFIGQWFDNKTSSAQAEDVTVGTADVIRDITLVRGSRLSGRVATTLGVGIADVNVWAQSCTEFTCTWAGGARTSADGTYSVSLANGTYKLRFEPPFNSLYIGQWYNGKSRSQTADDIVVNGDTPGIDAQLVTGYRIQGVVRDTAATPIANANVTVYTCVAGSGCNWIAGRQAGADGIFSVIVPPGTYKLRIDPPFGSPYVGEWYDNKTRSDLANAVTVGAADVTGLVVILENGFRISGRVTDLAGGAIANAFVTAYTGCPSNCQWIAGSSTGAEGTYVLAVAAGTYRIQFQAPPGSRLLGQWYNAAATVDTASDLVIATNTTNVNASLSSGYLISGRVLNTSGTALPNSWISALKCLDVSCDSTTPVGGTSAAGDGSYSLAVAPATYKVRINAPWGSSYVSEWHAGQLAFQLATLLTVTTSDVDLGDAHLRAGFRIQGHIRDGAGNGISNAFAIAKICSGGTCTFAGAGSTASDGSFSFLVPAGTYRVQFQPPQGSAFVQQWYNAKPDALTADAVPVAGDVAGIDATLAGGP